MSRTDAIRARLNREHFSCSLPCSASARFRIETAFSPGNLFRWGMANFTRFLTECVGASVGSDGTEIRFELDPSLPQSGFRLNVTPAQIRVTAASERGLVEAMHYIEREMVDRGEARLPEGELARFPSLQTRFTEGVFVPARQTADEPGDFSDEYLGLLGHFGANALKAVFSLASVWRSKTIPELNVPDFEETCAKLRCHARRLRDRGLDFYLNLAAKPYPGDHPVFQAHPEILGAREEIFLEETSGNNMAVLCTSQPKVLQAYSESLEALFDAVPELAGVILIIGGEGFRHCFMRPNVKAGQLTNCPHCQGQDPHEHVARLLNTLSRALKRAHPGKRLLAWPYSAFIWSKDDPTDSRWIRFLDPDVEVLSNFDCGDADATTTGQAYLFDYNIKQIGPSTRFAAQAAACRETGNRILAKTETNTTPDTFFLPYLPVHFRWYERFRAIRESGAAGLMGQWRFYGAVGSLPEELQYHAVWNPERSAEELLTTVARRDFNAGETAAREVVEGWRKLSQAWDSFPYSAMTCGETEAYMRGPWYLGPAHPLIFNEQSPYQLSDAFFRRRGDLGEMLSKEAIRLLPGKPRYICNLLICLPFGVEKYLELARRCRDQWDEGLAQIEAALPADRRTRKASEEIGICTIISIHLHTLVNTVEFLRLRESLSLNAISLEEFNATLEAMREVLQREIENAQRALPLLEADPRIGYGFTYNEVYDADMVRDKIRQCEFVKDRELPRIGSVIRFHVWTRYP